MLVNERISAPLYWKALYISVVPFFAFPFGYVTGSERSCIFHGLLLFTFTVLVPLLPQAPGTVDAMDAVPGTMMSIPAAAATDTDELPPAAPYPATAITNVSKNSANRFRVNLIPMSIDPLRHRSGLPGAIRRARPEVSTPVTKQVMCQPTAPV